MAETSPALNLPYIQPSQAQKHVTHNEALRLLDIAVQLVVQSAPQDTPPAIPIENGRYLVGTSPSGDWSGQAGTIAVYELGIWSFVEPLPGWRADVAATASTLRYDGSSWLSTPDTLQNLSMLGVAATADATNRLAVASESTLLTHAGNGHQVKVNKAAASDTASLLFQTGYSGRAEMGTSGSDSFAVKVSPDGAAWKDVLSADAATGALRIASGQTYLDDVFILDNTAYSFEIPWSNPARILMWMAVNLAGYQFLFSITGALAGSGNFNTIFVNPPGGLRYHTGVLTGTTGTAGGVNISVDVTTATPKMYIENRLGTNAVFTLSTLGR
ncbi:MAG: DUF2793 domain-containing protein [Cypionkella sp.]